MLSVLGWVAARYPYAPKSVTGRSAVALLCGAEQGHAGHVKATRGARERIARMCAKSESFGEARETLGECCGMVAAKETERLITIEAGVRTRKALREGRLARRPARRGRPPEGGRRVPLTAVVAPDGTCLPCAAPDLAGRRGRDGGQAKGRNANVVSVGFYDRVDGNGDPVFEEGAIRYYVTGSGGARLGRETWDFAVMEGILGASRVEFVSDGEKELEGVFQEHFAALPNCTRVLDAMHACGYVDTLAKALEPDEARAGKASRRLRRRLVNAGWRGFTTSLGRRYGAGVADSLDGDAAKAWAYLLARAGQMDYRNYRKRHLLLGSGMAEVGCKLTVGARLKGPGMRWRFDNGIGIATLRAVMRSRKLIVA